MHSSCNRLQAGFKRLNGSVKCQNCAQTVYTLPCMWWRHSWTKWTHTVHNSMTNWQIRKSLPSFNLWTLVGLPTPSTLCPHCFNKQNNSSFNLLITLKPKTKLTLMFASPVSVFWCLISQRVTEPCLSRWIGFNVMASPGQPDLSGVFTVR